ncbi:methyltransferase domain-containing protein [Micromonospora craniellae]|uniref:Methyltransferase domain-containing protein n=1 Tax=Micromonospora craniellae TaxID=2294034 RepID=A0A372FWL1_9ACTN|nr:methyltransferase domain-containing protein [Micromonospora craniellae]QOC93884.1 methyltransferase domain-containing protein [Micromonospora craniellae]RFS44936.1 methyltransferase domain-containing protein [Micromonospora craniellae]
MTGTGLVGAAFAATIELARARHLNVWEPWLPAEAVPPGAGLVRLLHLGVDVPAGAVDPAQAELIVQLGLGRRESDRLVAASWAVTAFRGVLAAGHREYGSGVGDIHIGEDSLRFAAAVLAAAPRGRVLDIGCGSGLASMAAARTAHQVLGLDVLPAAVEAFGISAALNPGLADCRAEVGDFLDLGRGDGYDAVVANLPGVPVPDGVPYPTAGDGGPDGLRLIRALWRWYAGMSTADSLVMRFQCPGGPRTPIAVAELAGFMPPGCDILVVTDSAVPMLVRNAITATRAATLDSQRGAEELTEELQRRCAERGWTHYHCSTLRIRRNGSGMRVHVPTPDLVDVRRSYRGTGWSMSVEELALKVGAELRRMPDEFWSVAGLNAIQDALAHLERIYTDLGHGATERQIASSLSDASTPLDQAAAVLVVSAIARVMVRMSLLVPVVGVDAPVTEGRRGMGSA